MVVEPLDQRRVHGRPVGLLLRPSLQTARLVISPVPDLGAVRARGSVDCELGLVALFVSPVGHVDRLWVESAWRRKHHPKNNLAWFVQDQWLGRIDPDEMYVQRNALG